jgi:hypothetical protein
MRVISMVSALIIAIALVPIVVNDRKIALEVAPFYLLAIAGDLWMVRNTFRGARVIVSGDSMQVQTIVRKFEISKASVVKVEIAHKYRGAVNMSMPCLTLESGQKKWLTDFSVPVGQEFRDFVRVDSKRWTLTLMTDAIQRWVHPENPAGSATL